MNIVLLGTGSAFSLQNYQSNFLIQHNGKNLLVDAGGDIRFSLAGEGLTYKDIDGVYISHAHADHTGGCEYLGFCSHFDPTYEGKMKFFCEKTLVNEIWNHTLRGGMEGIEGQTADLDTYFDVWPIPRNQSFEWEGIVFDLVQTVHVSAKYMIVDSFGLMFDNPDTGERTYITTDCQFAPETSMKAYYSEADVIFHDCETSFRSGVHSHYDDLRTLPEETKKKMFLYHFQDNVMDDWEIWQNKAHEDGFRGFCKKGMHYPSLDFSDLKYKS